MAIPLARDALFLELSWLAPAIQASNQRSLPQGSCLGGSNLKQPLWRLSLDRALFFSKLLSFFQLILSC